MGNKSSKIPEKSSSLHESIRITESARTIDYNRVTSALSSYQGYANGNQSMILYSEQVNNIENTIIIHNAVLNIESTTEAHELSKNTTSKRHSNGLVYENRSELDLVEFPLDLLSRPDVQWIDLSNNNIREVPEDIWKCFSLRRLAFGNNELSFLPETIGSLKELSWADFTHNLLMSVPESIGNLTNLCGLGISDCRISELPESIGYLEKLSKLGLYNNRLTTIPSSFRCLRNLVKLDLSNNLLVELPDIFGSLIYLQWLNLSHNNLISLPASLNSCKDLRELGLGNNRLASCPPLNNLKKLFIFPIYNNQLTELGSWIGECVSLLKIDLSCNKLTSLPKEIFLLPLLTYLNIRRNLIEEIIIPENVEKAFIAPLESFDANENLLRYLPVNFLACETLKEVKIKLNPWNRERKKPKIEVLPLKHLCLNYILQEQEEEDSFDFSDVQEQDNISNYSDHYLMEIECPSKELTYHRKMNDFKSSIDDKTLLDLSTLTPSLKSHFTSHHIMNDCFTCGQPFFNEPFQSNLLIDAFNVSNLPIRVDHCSCICIHNHFIE